MARVQFGGGVSGMSGSIQGNTFSHNRFGPYVRNRTTPVNPQSDRQTTVRQALALLTVQWSDTLTQAQRDAWDLYAESVAMIGKFGETIYLTGFNHFIRSNLIPIQSAAAAVAAGPTLFKLPDQDPTFAITASEATQTISFTFDNTLAWANETGAHLYKFQGKPQNPQRTFFGGPWRLLGQIDGDDMTPPTSPDDQTAQYTIAQGQRIWCYGRIWRADARLSEPFRAECLVGA